MAAGASPAVRSPGASARYRGMATGALVQFLKIACLPGRVFHSLSARPSKVRSWPTTRNGPCLFSLSGAAPSKTTSLTKGHSPHGLYRRNTRRNPRWLDRQRSYGSGQTGSWLRKVWIGGTGTNDAPLVADLYGNFSINGTFSVTNTATIGPTVIYETSSSEYAMYLTTLYSPRVCGRLQRQDGPKHQDTGDS